MSRLAPSTAAEPPAPPRSRRGRLFRGVVVIVLLAIGARVALWLLLPWVLDRVARAHGLRASVESIDLALLAGDATVRSLVVRPLEGGEPVADLEHLEVDVAMLRLLTGEFHVRRAEVDGLRLSFERRADGTWEPLRRFERAGSTPGDELDDEDEARDSGPFDLAVPFRMDALRLQHVRVRVVDPAATPPIDVEADLTLRVSHVGDPSREADVALALEVPGVLDALRVRGTLDSSTERWTASLQGRATKVDPRPIAGYLAALSIEPDAEEIDLTLEATAEARATGEERERLEFDARVTSLRIAADHAPAVGVDAIEFEATRRRGEPLEVVRVRAAGPSVRAARTEDGAFAAAGLKFLSSSAEPEDEPEPGPSMRLGRVVLEDGRVEWSDRTLEPALEIALELESVVVDASAAGDEDGAVTVEARLAAERLFDRLSLDGAVTSPSAPDAGVSFSLAAEAEGVRPEAVAGALAAAGLESTLVDGRLAFEVEGAVRPRPEGPPSVSIAVGGLVLEDEGRRLATLDRAAVEDLVVAPEGVHAAEIEVTGLSGAAKLEEDGAWRGAGLRSASAPPGDRRPSPPDANRAQGRAGRSAAPGLRVDRLRLHTGRLSLERAGAATPPLSCEELRLDVERLRLFGDGGGEPTALRLKVVAPEVAESLELEGSAEVGDDRVAASLRLRGEGITARALSPFLGGVEPALEDGRLEATLEASMAFAEDGLSLDAKVREVRLEDGEDVLVALEEASASNLRLETGAVDVADVTVAGLLARVTREAEGSLRVAGLRFTPAEPTDGPAVDPESESESESAPESALRVGRLLVDRVEIAFEDRAVAPETAVTLRLDAEADDLRSGATEGVGSFQVGARVVETGATIRLAGLVTSGPERSSVEVEVDGEGLALGPLGSYLPAGTASTLEDGVLRARIEASSAPVSAGGRSLELAVRDVALAGPRDADPLLAWDALEFRAPRVDLDARVFAVDELRWSGLVAEADVEEDGTLRVLGFAVSPSEESPETGAPPEGEANPADVAPPADAASTSSPAEPPPAVTIGLLHVDARRLAWTDRRAARPLPIVTEGLVLEAKDLEIDPSDPGRSPPVEVTLRASLPPVLETLEVDATVRPFALEPSLEATVRLAGLDGAAASAALPAWAEVADPAAIGAGSATARVVASLSPRHRSAFGNPFADAFGVELTVEEVVLRDERRPDAEAELLGLDALRIDVARVVPGRDVHVRSVELSNPRLDVVVGPEGVRAAGLLLPEPEPEAAADVDAADRPPAAAPVAGDGEASDAATARLDELVVTGGRFRLEDRTVDPPLVLPLRDVELEVRNLTTRALVEEIPFGFSLFLRADEVELPLEDEAVRPALGEAFVTGRLALRPTLTGRVKASVSALELANFRGFAADSGVTLTDGVLDLGTELRFTDDGAVDTTSRVTLTDLELSEPADGPISRWLKLPAPLDAVIFILRDPSGAIRFPLDFRVAAGGASLARVASTAAATLTRLIGGAVARSPLRVGLGAGRLVGLSRLVGGGEDGTTVEEPIRVLFDAGGVTPSESGLAELRALAKRLAGDETAGIVLSHELGREDEAIVRARKNPPLEDALALAARLRDHKRALLDERTDRKSEARAAFATGRDEAAAAARERLRALDRELVATEAALDDVLEVARRDAPRYAERRTRDGCVELARQRLEEVRRALLAAGAPVGEDRIRVRSPRYDAPERDGGGAVRIDAVVVVAAE